MLADAMATALGNDIRHRDKGVIKEALKRRLIDPVSGLIVVAGVIKSRKERCLVVVSAIYGMTDKLVSAIHDEFF